MMYRPSNSITERLKALFKRRIADGEIAYLGDSTLPGARVDVPGRPGYVYVRFPYGRDANGFTLFTPPTMARSSGAAYLDYPGAAVVVAVKYNNELEIVSAHYPSLDRAGINTSTLNPLNKQSKFVYPYQLTYGLANAVATAATASTLVMVKKLRYLVGNKLEAFDTPLAADKIDLASYIPATDMHCYAAVWIDTYTNAAVVTTSVAQSLFTPLDDTDLQELVVRVASSRPADGIPLKAFYLSNDQSTIVQNALDVDLRQWLDNPQAWGFPTTLTTIERVWPGRTLITGAITASGVGALTVEAGGKHIIVPDTVAPADATYLIKTADADLPNAQIMGVLATGLVKNTTTTGVQSIALAGTDYISPSTGNFLIDDAATNTVTNVVRIGHNTSGTPAANYGTGLVFQGESSTTPDIDMGRMRTIWTTASHASRVSNMIFSVYAIGVETDIVTVKTTGVVVVGAVTAFQNSTGYTELTHANASGNSNFPRSLFLGYGSASPANYGLYTAAGAATGTTQISSFMGISTNTNVKQASSKQLIIWTSTSEASFITQTAEAGSRALPIYFGRSPQLTSTVPDLAIATSGFVGVGVTSPSTPFHVVVTDTAANSVTIAQTMTRESTGAAGTGYGVGTLYTLKSSATSNQSAAAIDVVWVTATDASRVAKLTVSAWNISTKTAVADFTITGIQSALDMKVTASAKGFVLTDRTDGSFWRLVVTSGVLSIESA